MNKFGLFSMGSGFRWEGREGGLCSEAAYPYLAKDVDFCWDANCTIVPDTDVVSMTHLDGGDPEELMNLIAIQPTSIAMDAQTVSLVQSLFFEPVSFDLNHFLTFMSSILDGISILQGRCI